MAEPVLSFEQVGYGWDGAPPLLASLSLTVAAGECVALVGANGAGKSTLLRLACGLLAPSDGRVSAGGLDTRLARPSALARVAGMMFQEAERQLCCGRVRDEVAFAPRLGGLSATEVKRRTARALEATALASHADAHPFDLNAGERRLLTLAALIAQDVPLMLLDEPTRDFDAVQLALFEAWLAREKSAGRAILLISHDYDFVARNCPRVLHLAGGGVIADGPPEQVLHDPALQGDSPGAAPTLPALCRAIGLPPTTDAACFDAAWRVACERRAALSKSRGEA
ncbi:energy-coupling factor ABC transporter ATP-binding protein [Crenobacter caeni]|uniref:ABC transporter ATP-binding protein n=1 Tax=Crenobacter caeni TaxID=2705474 RepID=A0A6B2KU26_9NEIS|nr:ABC transporter ATP-binding protein [Crenobacter caeni]NDV13499.1 ABC transporter ATP-binding protein [Crenobacter caeni]